MKLLRKTIVNFVIYAVLVVIISTPVFYFTIQRLFTEEMDEFLQLRKKELLTTRQNLKSENDIRLFTKMDTDVDLHPVSSASQVKDSIYTVIYYDSLNHENQPFRELLTTIEINQKPYRLIIRESIVTNEDLIESIVIVQGTILIILLAGLLIINSLQAKKIWKPFYSLLKQLELYQLDKSPEIKLTASKIREFQDLNKSIQTLIQNNYLVFQQQKEFTENASHEMQTPLAVFQSKLELLLQTHPLSEEQAGIVQELYKAVKKLKQLNKSLLLLAKIENQQFPQKEKIILEKELRLILEQFDEQISRKNLYIQTGFKEETQLLASRPLLEVLLRNLISNAIRHSNLDSKIQISTKNNLLIIRNEGEGTQINAEKIFDRFSKFSKNQEGIGLGLAISQAICKQNHWDIHYTSENNVHVFSVHF